MEILQQEKKKVNQESLESRISVQEKEIFDLRQLLEISRALNSTLEYETIIQAVLDMCLAQVQTLHAALFLTPAVDAIHMEMVQKFKWLSLDHEAMVHRFFLHDPFLRFFTGRNGAFTPEEIFSIIGPSEEIDYLKEIGCRLVVPMKSRGLVIGLIIIGEKALGGDYPESERAFLSDLSSLAGIAVENARLYELATRDQMTGLRNHAFFHKKLAEEMELSRKNNRPVSILMADVDHFKTFNDTWGHQAGDEVLKRVASSFLDHCNTRETAARYGGEEFCLILPGLNSAEAIIRAENLRQSVEQMEVSWQGRPLHIHISIGVSTFDSNSECNSAGEVMQEADLALYECKRNGRNTVRHFRNDLSLTDTV